MDRFQVLVDLKDRRYAKRLIEFLTRRYGEQMQVEELNRSQPQSYASAILLTDQDDRPKQYAQVIWVSAEAGLNPYQSGHKIAGEIMKQKENWHLNEDVLEFNAKKGEWVSVYSPIGGIGTSTLAMGLADVLAKEKKVLFLLLEGASAWSLFFRYPLGYNLSDFFYCFLLSGPREWDKQIKEMMYQQKNGVYFLSPCQYPDDLLELRDSEVIGWMDLLKGSFDYVVADLGCQMLRPNRMILENSSKPCFIVDQKAEGRAKWQNFTLRHEALPNQWIFYRHADKSKQGEICLPEDSEIFEVQDGIKQFSQDSIYYSCLQKVVEGWI